MSDKSTRLGLPYIQASQAQKHVTHNDALRRLDALVQASVISKDSTTPPTSPSDGDSYIVPTNATADWAGQDGKLAVREDNAWAFYQPNEGWTVWAGDLDALWSFDGSAWVESAPPEDFQNIPMVGIHTTADATNRLSVSAAATLLNNEGAGHQLKINKHSTTDTASLLFQSAWTGHAEMGLAGNNDFSVKTSNGTSWFTALKCASSDGRVSFPVGLSGRIEIFDTGSSVFLGEGAGAHDDLSNNYNTFIGTDAGNSNTTGFNNTAQGGRALSSNTAGSNNSAQGVNALYRSAGSNNSAQGVNALYHSAGSNNSAQGYSALYSNTTGFNNTAQGVNALRWTTTGTNHTAYSNCSGVGYSARVSGSNQVQLGNASTTTYAYGAVQDRSDARDKADVRDTKLGLDFISRLRPVDFRWDMRDDYFDEAGEKDPDTGEVVPHLVSVKKDGSRKRGRFHHGLIAQEVAQVLKETGIDFGGYQNHRHSGNGEDVLTIGYTEMIAPLIRAVQELAAEIAALKAGS